MKQMRADGMAQVKMHQRFLFLSIVAGYVLALVVSNWLKPAVDSAWSSEASDLLFLNADASIMISDLLQVRIKDSRGDQTYQLGAMSVSDAIEHITRQLQTNGVDAYAVVGESYGALVAMGVASAEPDKLSSLTLVNPRGLPAFEWLGHPLLDRSLRSVQWSGLWLFEHGVPFSWNWAESIVKAKAVASVVARGGVVGVIEALQPAQPTLLIATNENVADLQFAAFRELFPRADLMNVPLLEVPMKWEQWRVVSAPLQAVDVGSVDPEVKLKYLSRQKAFEGIERLLAMLLIAASTMISEDLACIGSGILVSHGGISLSAAIGACFIGIYLGDLGIYFVGRLFGDNLLKRKPFSWMISRDAVLVSEQWFKKKGAMIIVASRFMPGTRVPVFFAAGVLQSSFWMVSTVLGVAALLWVPFLVSLSSWVGERMLVVYERYEQWAIWILLAIIISMFTAVHRLVPLLSHRGRRLWYSKWLRFVRWEFWPAKAVYPPVVVYILYLAVKYRSLTLPSLSNPIVPCGGLIDESKVEILDRLRDAGAPVAPYIVLHAGSTVEQNAEKVASAMQAWGTGFPIVVKPEHGERGKGVVIVKSETMLKEVLLQTIHASQIVQKFAPGMEFGVLYWRYPGAKNGVVSSITRKVYTSVVGDGISTLEELILNDSRAVCSAKAFLKTYATELFRVPLAGEKVKLVEIGTHARGALFIDACQLSTPALLAALDDISHSVEGYYLGRFDLKVPSEQSLMNGEGLQIVELNLLTSEPTHIYDPSHSIFYAWKALMRQWRVAFEIGAVVRAKGQKPIGTKAYVRQLWTHMMK